MTGGGTPVEAREPDDPGAVPTFLPVAKNCRRCGETKPRLEFPRNARTRDRLSSWCSACHNEAKRVARRRREVGNLRFQAERYERLADEDGLLAASYRSAAAALRRKAETKAALL